MHTIRTVSNVPEENQLWGVHSECCCWSELCRDAPSHSCTQAFKHGKSACCMVWCCDFELRGKLGGSEQRDGDGEQDCAIVIVIVEGGRGAGRVSCVLQDCV
jgi:hypothetical protein